MNVGEGGKLDGVGADGGGAAVDYEGVGGGGGVPGEGEVEALVEPEGGGHGGEGEGCAFCLVLTGRGENEGRGRLSTFKGGFLRQVESGRGVADGVLGKTAMWSHHLVKGGDAVSWFELDNV